MKGMNVIALILNQKLFYKRTRFKTMLIIFYISNQEAEYDYDTV